MTNQATETQASLAGTAAVVVLEVGKLPRKYFAANEVEQAGAYIDQMQTDYPEMKLEANYDTEADFEEGYGLLVFPVNTRSEKADATGEMKRIVKTDKIMIARVPDINAMVSGQSGDAAQAFVQDVLTSKFADKLSGSDKTGSVLPSTLVDFITQRGRNSELAAYNSVAKTMVAALHKRGLKTLTQAILRQCLESNAFAESQYDTVPAEFWVSVLDICAGLATKDNLDTAIFTHWKETRDAAKLAEVKLDLDLSGMLAD